MKKKSILCMALSLVLAVSFAGCGDDDDDGGSKSNSSSQSGADSLDEAVKLYFGGIYDKDFSKIKQVLPKKFLKANPNAEDSMKYFWMNIDNSEFLPDGIDGLDYDTEEQDVEDWDQYEDKEDVAFIKYIGMDSAEKIWTIDAGVGEVEDDLIVFMCDDKYFVYGDDTYEYIIKGEGVDSLEDVLEPYMED